MANALSPELFDLPGDLRPKRMYKACGEIGKGKTARRCHVFVQASSDHIAARVGRTWLQSVHKAKLVCVIPFTWEEYAKVLQQAGFEISPPLPKRKF